MAFDGAISDLYKAQQTGQEKHTYFLLAAAGAAIGFAVQKADGLKLTWWLLPVAIAAACWAGSFYSGCKNVVWAHVTISANMALLQLQNGTHPQQPPVGDYTSAAIDGTRNALEENASTARAYAVWQFRLLVIGAVFFIAWRIVEMVRIS